MIETQYSLDAKQKKVNGKGISRKIRARGMIPAIYYGPGIKNLMLEVNPMDILKILHYPKKINTVVKLNIENDKTTRYALIKNYSFHPVTRKLLHCDLYNVTAEQKIKVKVPIKIVGQTEGEKISGRNNWIVRQLTVQTTPDNIPESIEVNVEGLKIGQKLKISSINLPAGVEAIYSIDQPVIISNAPKKVIAEEGADTTEEVEEPEQ